MTIVAIPYKSLIRQYIFSYYSFPAQKSTDNSKNMKLIFSLFAVSQCRHHTVVVRFMDNGYVWPPPADYLAAPINHGSKVNAKDIGMHAQQPINLLRTTPQPCCS